jgi:hypothetical protein
LDEVGPSVGPSPTLDAALVLVALGRDALAGGNVREARACFDGALALASSGSPAPARIDKRDAPAPSSGSLDGDASKGDSGSAR